MSTLNDIALGIGGIVILLFCAMILSPQSIPVIGPLYNIWSSEQAGKAELAQAEWNRQITVKEAEARLDSEKLNAQSEVERAKGVAKANTIIGDSLENNTAYLTYLWIQGLHDGSSEIIYIPTESNLPILEATRFD